MGNAGKKWMDMEFDVDKLNLDLKNPRIPAKNRENEASILEYLLEYENVLEIAKNIAENGYHRSAVSIVCEENGRKVVLDGNRRLAACKLLLNPELSTKKKYLKMFQSLHSTFDANNIEKVKITIAPDRDSAEKEIWDIHLNPLMKKWQVIQKLRKYRELARSSSVKEVAFEYRVAEKTLMRELVKLSLYEKISEKLLTKDQQEKLLKIGLNKIERILVPEHGEVFLGYTGSIIGEITSENEGKLENNLKKIIPYILSNEVLKAACSKKEIEDVFVVCDSSYKRTTIGDKKSPNPNQFELFKNNSGDNEAKESEGYEEETSSLSSGNSNENNNKNITIPRLISGTLAKNDWITDGEYKAYIGANKIKLLLKEMKQLDPKNNTNILMPSLRVLLELSLYHKLEEKKHITKIVADYKINNKTKNTERISKEQAVVALKKNWSPSFREMLNYIVDEKNNVIDDPQAREVLEKMIKNDKNFVSDLNDFIHNVHDIPAKDDPEKTWRKFGRPLFSIIEKIKLCSTHP